MLFWLLLLLAPPKKEFHQGVAYRIEARLDDSTHVLTGHAQMRYTNNSRDRLDTLYFHLHLNAFRPNSAWAQRQLQFDDRRYQDLGPDDYAFDRISAISVNGKPVKPFFPHAPDSTVMAIALPTRLAPKGVATVDIKWASRMATIPRRQGRAGRHYDWAHWYPRIAVYDTAGWETQVLLPQGEFYGEFATYDVTLDVPADQVIAATGVVTSGDPGWTHASRSSTDRKQVSWHAEHVHHFAWAADPAFIHEGGRLGDVALHAFYLPGDSLWPGRVIETLKKSLLFYDSVLGPYVYPQLTASRRLDGGGTEFPMMQMDGASPPVVHEAGHEWAHAMLANNEWKEGWLDEGLVSFLGFMYAEAAGTKPNYQRAVETIARIDAAGQSQPLETRSADFRDFNTYQLMTYTKPSLVIRMLRYYLGDTAFRKGLKLFYRENVLTHVDENDFRRAFEQASGRDLTEFFRQWWHTTGTVDWGIQNATTTQQGQAYVTRVDLVRNGDNWMPVDLQVGDKIKRVDSHDRNVTVTISSSVKPQEVVLDPDYVLLDVDRSNNRRTIE